MSDRIKVAANEYVCYRQMAISFMGDRHTEYRGHLRYLIKQARGWRDYLKQLV